MLSVTVTLLPHWNQIAHLLVLKLQLTIVKSPLSSKKKNKFSHFDHHVISNDCNFLQASTHVEKCKGNPEQSFSVVDSHLTFVPTAMITGVGVWQNFQQVLSGDSLTKWEFIVPPMDLPKIVTFCARQCKSVLLHIKESGIKDVTNHFKTIKKPISWSVTEHNAQWGCLKVLSGWTPVDVQCCSMPPTDAQHALRLLKSQVSWFEEFLSNQNHCSLSNFRITILSSFSSKPSC